MREIKFRAWNRKTKTMYTNVQQSYDTIKGIDCCGDIAPADNWRSFGEVLLDKGLDIMQFTGLLDKNGKEIYEGDIVRDFKGALHDVAWSVDHYRFGIYVLNEKGLDDLEVIGNIYENPELTHDRPT